MTNDGLCREDEFHCMLHLDFFPVVFSVWFLVLGLFWFFLMENEIMKLVIKAAYKNSGKCIAKQHGLVFFYPSGH